MNKTTVYFRDPTAEIDTQDVEALCRELHGWTPDAVREVESGENDVRAYMCFESAQDADLWDNQK